MSDKQRPRLCKCIICGNTFERQRIVGRAPLYCPACRQSLGVGSHNYNYNKAPRGKVYQHDPSRSVVDMSAATPCEGIFRNISNYDPPSFEDCRNWYKAHGYNPNIPYPRCTPAGWRIFLRRVNRFTHYRDLGELP